jgi:hypothetical protein
MISFEDIFECYINKPLRSVPVVVLFSSKSQKGLDTILNAKIQAH